MFTILLMCNIMIVLPLGSLWTDHWVSLHPVNYNDYTDNSEHIAHVMNI